MLKVKNKKVIPFFDYKRQLKRIQPTIDFAIQKVFESGRLILDNEVKKLKKKGKTKIFFF